MQQTQLAGVADDLKLLAANTFAAALPDIERFDWQCDTVKSQQG